MRAQFIKTTFVWFLAFTGLNGHAQPIKNLELAVLTSEDLKPLAGEEPSCANKVYRMSDNQWVATVKSYADDVRVVSGAIFDSKRIYPGKQVVQIKISGEANSPFNLSVLDNQAKKGKPNLEISGGVALSKTLEIIVSGDLLLIKEGDKCAQTANCKKYHAHLSLTAHSYQKTLFNEPVWVLDQCRTNTDNQVFREIPIYQKLIWLLFALINGGH